MLISVLRRPEGLFALTASRVEPFVVPPAKGAACEAGNYAETVQGLEPAHGVPYQSILMDAVGGLRAVRQPSAEALASAFHVLVGSVPDPGGYAASLSNPRFDDATEVPRRTAGNPRGFQGTKFKPPKSAAPRDQDLLPFLDGGNHEAALLQGLSTHLSGALDLCTEDTEYGSLLEAAGERVVQPYGQIWPSEAQTQIPGLPTEFRRYFLWACRGVPWSSVGQLIASYWSLRLGGEPKLRLLTAQMVASLPTATPIEWISALDAAPPARRECLAELMFETGAFKVDRAAPRELIQQLEALCPTDEHYRHRAYHLLDRVRHGLSERYLLDGFELANQYEPDHAFREQGEAGRVRSVIEIVMERLQDHSEEWQRTAFAMTLWQRCGELKQFAETLGELPWNELDADCAYWTADFLGGIAYHDADEEAKAAIWDAVRARSHKFVAALQEAKPEYREKVYETISEVVWIWNDAERLGAILDDYFVLVPRLCCPPSSLDDYSRDPLSSFSRLPKAEWQAVCDAPDDSFRAMEKASRRKNDARMLGLGIWSLAKHLPELTAKAFQDCPAVLFRCSKTLGCMPGPVRAKLLAESKRTPAFECDPTKLAPERLLALVEDGADKPSSHVSKRLREHLVTGASMTTGQMQRALDKVTAHWSEILLSKLYESATKSMGKDLHADIDLDDPKIRHAVMMQFSVAEHRRALRKLLKARLAGDTTYVDAHPETRQWFRKHSAIDANIWSNGIAHQRSSVGSELTLSIEHDPLEVLRMGTYAGTCLGLGGGLAYSAAAVVLDANKQVIYCRNSRDTVLARQLVALSEKEQLYCFDVYPEAVADDIKRLFWEYDKAFAEALGVPVHDPDADDDDDDIAFLLARDWWYDYPVRVE